MFKRGEDPYESLELGIFNQNFNLFPKKDIFVKVRFTTENSARMRDLIYDDIEVSKLRMIQAKTPYVHITAGSILTYWKDTDHVEYLGSVDIRIPVEAIKKHLDLFTIEIFSEY